MQSKIDDLIAAQVSDGNLTSDQATELKGVFAAAFANGANRTGGGHHHRSHFDNALSTDNSTSSTDSSTLSSTDSSMSTTSTTDSSSTDPTSQILQDFMKLLQDLQSAMTNTYTANGTTATSVTFGALLFNFTS
jgi:hypothetical protein